MLLTEQEAREKWCPFSRAPGRVIGRHSPDEPDIILGFCAQNRGLAMGGPLENCRCIASNCMAWRWEWSEEWRKEIRAADQGKTKGYCGLAGKPAS